MSFWVFYFMCWTKVKRKKKNCIMCWWYLYIYRLCSGQIWTERSMALAAVQSICLYRDEIIGNASYFRSGLTSHARFHQRRVVNLRGVALMKIRLTSKKSKYFQLIRPYRNFCCFGSEFATLLSSVTEKISSSSGTSSTTTTTKHEVAPNTSTHLVS